MTQQNETIGPRLLSWKQLRDLVPLSRTTVWRRVRDKQFPEPLKISPGRVAWAERDVVEWIAHRMKNARL
jgi:prophage regulatory protein